MLKRQKQSRENAWRRKREEHGARERRIRPRALLDDISNAVVEYCVQGFDSFDRCLLSLPCTEEQAAALLQGSARLHARLQARLARHLAAFERTALATSLHVPAGLLLPGQGAGSAAPPPADPEEEAAVDAELAAKSADLDQSRAAARSLESELVLLKRELAARGDVKPLAAVAAAAAASAGGKENVAADAAVVQARARELAALLPRAAEAQAARRSAIAATPTPGDPVTRAEKAFLQRQAAAGSASAADLGGVLALLQP
ncbi:hypothetical protein WJX81_001887 [Elliptochloris bilobata]|uniref:Uncharacterized protein n=1 Tax=Elliptochloris bilobata TaxID=381761 RepID=A0AAW1QY05_9CHLO